MHVTLVTRSITSSGGIEMYPNASAIKIAACVSLMEPSAMS
jgi:hypothetical protein